MTHGSTPSSQGVAYLLWLWFALTALSVAYVAYDQFQRSKSEQTLADRMKQLDWVLFTLYTGPLSVFLYRMVRFSQGSLPIWQRAAHSTVHCGAGQLTGMLLAALIAAGLQVSSGKELVAEYLGGLSVGLLFFKAPGMWARGGSYWQAARGSWLSEMLAMNVMMAGQIPVMAFLMMLDGRAKEPTSVLFWGMVSISFIAGSLATYLLKWLAPGLGAEQDSSWRKLAALLLTLAMLAGSVAVVSSGGFFHSMGPM